MVSTHLKNISQNGSFPQVRVKIKNLWNHHLDHSCQVSVRSLNTKDLEFCAAFSQVDMKLKAPPGDVYHICYRGKPYHPLQPLKNHHVPTGNTSSNGGFSICHVSFREGNSVEPQKMKVWLVQMILLFKQLIFRFQPFDFRGCKGKHVSSNPSFDVKMVHTFISLLKDVWKP